MRVWLPSPFLLPYSPPSSPSPASTAGRSFSTTCTSLSLLSVSETYVP